MKNNIIIGLLIVTILGICVVLYLQTMGAVDNDEIVGMTEVIEKEDSIQKIATATEAQVAETTSAQTSSTNISKVAGVSFTLSSDWRDVTKPEMYELMGGGHRGVSYESTDVVKRELSEFEVTWDYSDLVSGLTFGLAFSPENLTESLEDSSAYVDFQIKAHKDCSNCSHLERVTVDNIPAVLVASRAENNGGGVNVSLYKDGEIFIVSMGYSDSYDQVESLFRQILSTVNFTE